MEGGRIPPAGHRISGQPSGSEEEIKTPVSLSQEEKSNWTPVLELALTTLLIPAFVDMLFSFLQYFFSFALTLRSFPRIICTQFLAC